MCWISPDFKTVNQDPVVKFSFACLSKLLAKNSLGLHSNQLCKVFAEEICGAFAIFFQPKKCFKH